METITQTILIPEFDISLSIRREDLIHPTISGNKFRKLKYNLQQARIENKNTLLTFGGAYSNHIAAVAAAGAEQGFETIGIIRGEELAGADRNPTLQFAHDCGMKLEYVTRTEYASKSDEDFVSELRIRFGAFYLIPEGGTNPLAVKGCEEILAQDDFVFDYICCAVGTGGTIAGIINSSAEHQTVLGFPSLKGNFLKVDISKFAVRNNWRLIEGYEFGGYAKIDESLVNFINRFYMENAIPLDPIYTGKMIFGVMDLIGIGYFPKGSKILAIHTGGLQGIKGMNDKLKNKNATLIETK